MPGPMPLGQKRVGPVDPGAAARLCPPSLPGVHLWCEPLDDVGAPRLVSSARPLTVPPQQVRRPSESFRQRPTSAHLRVAKAPLAPFVPAYTWAGPSLHSSVGTLQLPPAPWHAPLRGRAGQCLPHLQASAPVRTLSSQRTQPAAPAL